jgi:nucleotide-binding universal stress UspA family protein
MGGIVCAIRGGPHSRATVGRAIALAQETGLSLWFLYVVNLEFLARTSTSRVRTISEQMEAMGESILLTAQAQAEAEGVTALAVVRHGEVGDEIVALCRELEADYLVLGQPEGDTEDNVFTRERLRQFRSRMEEETGANLILSGEEGS